MKQNKKLKPGSIVKIKNMVWTYSEEKQKWDSVIGAEQIIFVMGCERKFVHGYSKTSKVDLYCVLHNNKKKQVVDLHEEFFEQIA